MTSNATSLSDHDDVTDAARPLRADALRNRAKILEAAEHLFANGGVDVPVEVIAEHAGVGIGTVYRHFPTKERLCEAILIERMAELISMGRTMLATDDPARAFFDFVNFLTTEVQHKKDIISAFESAGVDVEVLATSAKQELNEVLEELLRAAQRAGAVRADVSGPTVFSLVGATCMASKHLDPGTSIDAMLVVLFDGLRTAS